MTVIHDETQLAKGQPIDKLLVLELPAPCSRCCKGCYAVIRTGSKLFHPADVKWRDAPFCSAACLEQHWNPPPKAA